MPYPHVVLIVEDDQSIAYVLTVVVEEAGATPLLARNGREGLAIARESPPDLVITDLMMPVMDGQSLVRALRKDAADEGGTMPPVILITAASPLYAELVGADVILHKPFDLAELESEILRLIA